MMRIGFVGGGKMASAILSSLLKNGCDPSNLTVSDSSEEARARHAAAGVCVTADNAEAFLRSDLVFLAVKPQHMTEALAGIGRAADGKTVVTMAAGIRTETIRSLCPGASCVIRMMPNTPMMLNQGTIAVAFNDAGADDVKAVTSILSQAGEVFPVDESLMNAVTALSGSGPAYFYRVAKVLADEAAVLGIPRDMAVRMAAKTMAGAAEMMLTAGKTPEELLRDVSSAKGTTVAALEAFDAFGLDEALKKGVDAASRRCEELANA